MPNIRTYTNPIEGLNPSDRGISAYDSAAQSAAIAGRSIAGSYEQLGREIGSTIGTLGGEYQEHISRQEITKGMADAVTLQDSLTKSWKDVASNADPNDHGVRDRFLELQEETLQNFPGQFQTKAGQEWAQQQVGHLRQHMYEMTAADQASREGSALVQNFTVLSNRGASLLASDPTQFNLLAGTLDRAADALVKSNPNVDPAVAARLRTETVQQIKEGWAKTAITSVIDRNPAAGREAIASGALADYLSGSDLKSLETYSHTVDEAKLRDARQAQEDQKKADKAQADQANKQLYVSGLQSDGTWAPPANFAQTLATKLAPMAGTNMTELREWGSMAKTFQEDQANARLVQSNPVVYDNFVNRMSIPEGQPGALTRTEIYQAAALRSLSNHDAQILVDGIDKAKDPAEAHLMKATQAFIESQKTAILGTGVSTASRHQKYYEFTIAMQNAVQLARQEGLTPQQAEERLLDPTSKYYLGGQSLHMGYYTGSATKYGLHRQAAQATAAPEGGTHNYGELSGVAAQPKWDGKEPLDAYLKRIGK